MNKEQFDDFLKNNNACSEEYDFVKGCTLDEAIDKIDRLDWLMWLMRNLRLPKETYAMMAIACADHFAQSALGTTAIAAAKKCLLRPSEETYKLACSYVVAAAMVAKQKIISEIKRIYWEAVK